MDRDEAKPDESTTRRRHLVFSVTRMAATLPFAGALFQTRQVFAQPVTTFPLTFQPTFAVTPTPTFPPTFALTPSPTFPVTFPPSVTPAPMPAPGPGPAPGAGPSPGNVPEPASIALLGSVLAIGGAGLLARRVLERWAEDEE